MRLYLKNFMSHDESVIDLPDRGVVQVTGPNGAGKSALIEGVAQALWGKTCRTIRWSPWREQAGHVKLRDGDLSVDRDWNGKTKRLTFGTEKFDTSTKAQEALEAVVGPFEVWRRTCVFSSADAAHFTLASDAERKELLEQLLGLGWFDRALTLCRTDLRSARAALAVIDKDADILAARLEAAKTNLSRLDEAVDEMPPDADVGLLRAEVEAFDKHIREIGTEDRELAAKYQKLLGTGATEKERASVAADKLRRLKEAECYACGQAVSDAVRSSLQHDVDAALKAAREARERVQTELDALSKAREELAEELAELRQVRDKKYDRLRELESNKAARLKVRNAVEAARKDIREASEKVIKLDEERAQLRVDVAELEACEHLLGTRGVRARVVAQTLSSIEALANAWMARLGSKIEIGLRAYTERKSGAVVDAISLVLSGAGGDQGYLGASAGERRRVDVALLLSLAELASARSTGGGWRSPIFFDEVFDSLDVDGREAVIELVEDLAKDRCVVLITHDETVASAGKGTRIRIDGGSVCT